MKKAGEFFDGINKIYRIGGLKTDCQRMRLRYHEGYGFFAASTLVS